MSCNLTMVKKKRKGSCKPLVVWMAEQEIRTECFWPWGPQQWRVEVWWPVGCGGSEWPRKACMLCWKSESTVANVAANLISWLDTQLPLLTVHLHGQSSFRRRIWEHLPYEPLRSNTESSIIEQCHREHLEKQHFGKKKLILFTLKLNLSKLTCVC